MCDGILKKPFKNSVLFEKGYEYMISFTYLVLYEIFAEILPEIVNNNPLGSRKSAKSGLSKQTSFGVNT